MPAIALRVNALLLAFWVTDSALPYPSPTHNPFVHIPEQHSMPFVHEVLLARQAQTPDGATRLCLFVVSSAESLSVVAGE
jgi:hypothetical protein